MDVADLGILAANFRAGTFAAAAQAFNLPADAVAAVVPELSLLALLGVCPLALRQH